MTMSIEKRTVILGISAYFHDSAAALVIDGEIVAAAQEERFSRIKHDADFPIGAVRYVLHEAGLTLEEVTRVVFYEKPFLKFERLLETYHAFAPKGLRHFLKAMPIWLKQKLFLRKTIARELRKIGRHSAPILFSEHHLSHAASAFFPSPFTKAAVLTIDGVGERASASIGIGEGATLEILKELHFPHSVGLLYSTFTYYGGFRVNSGEYKLMGLAPYSDDNRAVDRMVALIKEHLVDIREDGSIVLNMSYFSYTTGFQMANDKKWTSLFGFPPRTAESDISESYINLAKAAQQIVEEIVTKLAATAKELTQCDRLVLAGGVALNCVANEKLFEENIFEDIWIQPAAGDAGGALGAALAVYYMYFEAKRRPRQHDAMKGAYLGPSFSNKNIANTLEKFQVVYSELSSEIVFEQTAEALEQGKVVGWFQGRMEFGPRALGNRSILADPTNVAIQQTLNSKIKFRESFRPFAPSILEEMAADYFDSSKPSPYMLKTTTLTSEVRQSVPPGSTWQERLYQVRSKIPAVTHLDHSARVQTVSRDINPRFHALISKFYERIGTPILVNTSFNVRGEPIVCSPEDALRCFFQTDMDVLVLENFICHKADQPLDIKERLGVVKKMLD